MPDLVCAKCGVAFWSKHSTQRCCSRRCGVLGGKLSDETKRKLREYNISHGIVPPSREGTVPPNKGLIGWKHAGSFGKREKHWNCHAAREKQDAELRNTQVEVLRIQCYGEDP